LIDDLALIVAAAVGERQWLGAVRVALGDA